MSPSYYQPDTIVAQATPQGHGAVGIIRVSGPQAIIFLKKIFRGQRDPSTFESHKLYWGSIVDPIHHHPWDQVLVVWMKAPHSFTGEDVVEIQTHGSPLIIRRIISFLTQQGCRLAEPGEFSQRAFLNGKMDLTQAEAIADLIAAQTEAGTSLAFQQLSGTFSNKINNLIHILTEVLALLEVGFDFSEEDVSFINKDQIINRINLVYREIDYFIDSFKTGQMIKNGIKLALIGKPNVGKSSLLNRLLLEEKSIIHEEPGTTRDIITGERHIGGVLFNLYDTAGIREAVSLVEQEGIRRSEHMVQKADLILFLLDLSRPLEPIDKEIYFKIKHKPHLLVLTKKDQPSFWTLDNLSWIQDAKICSVSVKTDEGINELIICIERLFIKSPIDNGHNYVLNNVRHYVQLKKARDRCKKLQSFLVTQNMPEECLAEELRSLSCDLKEITGGIFTEDILGAIFSRFCIGK